MWNYIKLHAFGFSIEMQKNALGFVMQKFLQTIIEANYAKNRTNDANKGIGLQKWENALILR